MALLVVFMAMAAVCVVLAPRVIAPGLRMMQPISRMKQSQTRLPRKHVRSLEELRQVPDVIQGVSEMVTGELDAYVAGRMTPEEYHWVSRIVYERWRGSLKRAGRYPAALRAAAAEVDAATASERDGRVRARLQALAAQMRAREPAPPESFDPETHRLLLARLDDVEKWSLDDTESHLSR